MKSLETSGIAPMSAVPDAIRKKLADNEQLMVSLELNATPAMYWQEPDGSVQMMLGEDKARLPEILGPN